MAWKKSSPELIARFTAALPKDAAVEPRPMFGYPAAFARGYYFSGLFEESVVIRMPEPQKSRLPALAGAHGFSPMGNKPMTDWYLVPETIAASTASLGKFLRDALALVKELPVKSAPAKRSKITTGKTATGKPRASSSKTKTGVKKAAKKG